MRALEISILLIMVLTAPSVIQPLGVIPTVSNTCTSVDCQARTTILNIASSFELQSIDTTKGIGQIAWDALVLTVTFPIYAAFWTLYFLSLIVLVGPAIHSMFGVPETMTVYLNLGIWILWLTAYVQYKRGGLGLDAAR